MQVVDAPASADTVAFGGTVTFRRDDGRVQTYRIVGEDEADPKAGTISYVSPVAQRLLGRAAATASPSRAQAGMPQRAFALQIIDLIEHGSSDDDIVRFIDENYRLVLLTREETAALNRLNRSRITRDRLAEAGIELWKGLDV